MPSSTLSSSTLSSSTVPSSTHSSSTVLSSTHSSLTLRRRELFARAVTRPNRFAPVLDLLRGGLSDSVTLWSGETGEIIASSADGMIGGIRELSALVQTVSGGNPQFVAEVGPFRVLAVPVLLDDGMPGVATAPFLTGPPSANAAARMANWCGVPAVRWQEWAAGESVWHGKALLKLAAAVQGRIEAEGRAQRAEGKTEAVSQKLATAEEEIDRGNRGWYRQRSDLLQSIVQALVSAIDAKDPYTSGHSDRVARLAVRIALELRCNPADIKTIYLGGLLHDVGKIGIDDQVLRKTGHLTEQEFDHIKQHPELGYRILADLKQLAEVLPAVLHHHEQWDGCGYPAKLVGEEIPRIARIIAVADSYDAMTSDRPYRQGMAEDQVDRIFREGTGRCWDPDVVTAFFKAKDDLRAIS